MGRKLLDKALVSPANVRFGEMVKLVGAFGFRPSRVSGSHHIFVHPNVNGMAKPYQVRQFLKLVARYNLTIRGES